MDKLSSELLRELLSAVGDYLGAAEESASIVVVGGATLSILGWVQRTTADVDVIARAVEQEGETMLVPPDPLPDPLKNAIRRAARDYGVSEEWMNTVVGAQWKTGPLPTPKRRSAGRSSARFGWASRTAEL